MKLSGLTGVHRCEFNAIAVRIFDDGATSPGRVGHVTDYSHAASPERFNGSIQKRHLEANVDRGGLVASLAWIKLQNERAKRGRIMPRPLAMLFFNKGQPQ